MPDLVHINTLDDMRVSAYRHLADPDQLLDLGLFVAEGRLVVRRLIDLQHWAIESILLTQPAADSLVDLLPKTAAPIYLADQELMNGIAGFNIHRGCLALVRRPPTPSLDRIAAGPLSRVLVLEGVNNPDNVGGLFRNALALDVDGILLGPDCVDPLYRKAVRVSCGASLVVPFAQVADWPGVLEDLRRAGMSVLAMTPSHDATPIEELTSRTGARARIALLLGAEGDGLSPQAQQMADVRVRISIAAEADSLNVVVATGIALHALR